MWNQVNKSYSDGYGLEFELEVYLNHLETNFASNKMALKIFFILNTHRMRTIKM